MRKLLLTLTVICAATLSAAAQQGIVLRGIDGKSYDTGALLKEGHPTVVSFFATWCKPCLRELNAISEEYEEWREETGVLFVAVSIDSAHDSEKVAPLANGNAWDFLVLLDPEGELKRLLHVQTVPHTVVFDRTGKIIDIHTGYTDGDEKRLYSILKDKRAE